MPDSGRWSECACCSWAKSPTQRKRRHFVLPASADILPVRQSRLQVNLASTWSYSFRTRSIRPWRHLLSHRLDDRVDWRKGQIGPTSMRRLGESCDYTFSGYAHVTVFDNAEMCFWPIAWADCAVFQLKRAVRRGYILGH